MTVWSVALVSSVVCHLKRKRKKAKQESMLIYFFRCWHIQTAAHARMYECVCVCLLMRACVCMYVHMCVLEKEKGSHGRNISTHWNEEMTYKKNYNSDTIQQINCMGYYLLKMFAITILQEGSVICFFKKLPMGSLLGLYFQSAIERQTEGPAGHDKPLQKL